MFEGALLQYQSYLADAGYRGEVAAKIKKVFGYALEVIVSGNKSNGFKPIGKRWIVERTSHGLIIIGGSAELRIYVRFGRGDGETCCNKNVAEQNLNRLIVFPFIFI